MIRLRHYFIPLYVVFLVVLGGYALYRMLAAGDPWWGGPALVTLPMLGRFALFMTRQRTARTHPYLPGLLGLGGGGTVIAAVGWGMAGDGAAFGWAALGLILLLAYVFWYSRLSRAGEHLAVGEPLPAFEARTPDGERVGPERFRGRYALYLFFRGNWCPFCMAQVREVAAQYRALEARGVAVVLVSPQPPEHTRQLAERFGVPMHFWVDAAGQAARTLGLFDEKGVPAGMSLLGYDADTVLPTVLLVDPQGRIRYLDQTNNYRVRPDPSQFLAILDEVNG